MMSIVYMLMLIMLIISAMMMLIIHMLRLIILIIMMLIIKRVELQKSQLDSETIFHSFCNVDGPQYFFSSCIVVQTKYGESIKLSVCKALVFLLVQTLQMKPSMTYDIGRNRTMSTKEQIYIGAKVQKCKSRKQSVC